MKQSNNHPIRKRTIFGLALLFIVMQLSAQPDSIANRPQFLYPEFTRSIVKLKSGDSHAAMMNYNTVTGKMIYYQDGLLLDLIKPETVDTIFMQNALPENQLLMVPHPKQQVQLLSLRFMPINPITLNSRMT